MKQTITVKNQEHFGIARKIVSNMTSESWETIPHAVVTYNPEVSGLLKVLKEITQLTASRFIWDAVFLMLCY